MNDFDIGSIISWSGTGGGDYYISPEDCALVTSNLIYTGKSTTYLYPADSPQSTNSYPYVVLYPGRYAEYRTSYNSSTTITNARNVLLNPLGQFYRDWKFIEPVILMIIAFSCLVRLFKS